MNGEVLEAIHEQARDKALDLSCFFSKLQESVAPENASLTLNMLFLLDACESSLIDLERHKEFHQIDLEDKHKRAAFLFKWLAHMRPVNVTGCPKGKGVGKIVRINAYFALLAALGELDVDMNSFAPSKIAQNMIYAGAYRDINPAIWALTFCLLEKTYPATD